MNVLKLDCINYRELYEYLDDGENILHDLINTWSNTQAVNNIKGEEQ